MLTFKRSKLKHLLVSLLMNITFRNKSGKCTFGILKAFYALLKQKSAQITFYKILRIKMTQM